MDQEIKRMYREMRSFGLEFISNEIISELMSSQTDKEYLDALEIVKMKINVTIAREGAK